MNSSFKICRLCLETIIGNDFEAMDEIVEQMFDKLLLTIDIDIIKEPLICKKCVVNLDKSVNFKSTCLNTVNLSLGEIKSEKDEDVDKDHKSCRFCMIDTKIGCCIYFNETKQNVFIVDVVVQKHIPELKFNVAQEVITCTSCLDALQILSSFIMKCLDVEDEIKKYAESFNDTPGQINLYDIQQLIYKPIIKCENSCSDENSSESLYSKGGDGDLKIGIENGEFEDVSELDLNIKIEEIDIKPEQNESERTQELSTLEKNGNGCLDLSGLQSQNIQKGYEKNHQELTKHLKQHKLVHKCEHCPYETQRRDHLKRHKLIHESPSDIRMFKCDLCSFETKYKQCIKYHKLTHEGASKPMFKCDMCPYETVHMNRMQKHKLKHKRNSDVTMFKCDTCTFETKHKRNLGRHVLLHNKSSDLIIFKCDTCSFEAKCKSDLEEHKLTHTTAFKCKLCSYESKRRYLLTRHQLTHKSPSDITMFKCKLCSYEAKRGDHLKLHQLTHESPTMYRCKLCLFEAKCRSHLKQHQLANKCPSDVPVFKCNLCPYEAKRRDYLKKHQLIHKSPPDKFKCKLCPYKTRRRDCLKRHQLLMHKNPSDVKEVKININSVSYV